ncbi:MAG: NAD(P)H-binding protein [Bacteroidota bacterium]
MHLTIFGATGRTGREAVTQALAAGHTVTAFARDEAKLSAQQDRSNTNLHAVIGDVRDAEAVHRAIEGANAVLSCLAPVPKDGQVQAEGTRHIASGMAKHRVQRIVSLTGAGVTVPSDPPRAFAGRFIRGIMKVVASGILADAEAHADILRRSELDYAIVRAPRLTDGPHTGLYRHGILQLGFGDQIARADVADFMLAEAASPQYRRQAPHVTSV